MTELLEKAFQVARQLSPAMQDEMARTLLLLSGHEIDGGSAVEVSQDDWAAIEEGRAAARRGDFATEEDMAATWSRFGA